MSLIGKCNLQRANSISRSRGITLIEVMIAVLVLAVGLLGLGALQSFALQSSQMASQRTLATTLATRVADEYRSYRSLDAPPQRIQADWAAEVARVLPNGALTHSRSGDEITITVTWRDDRDEDSPSDGDKIEFETRI